MASSDGSALLGFAWRTPLGATIDLAMSRLFAGERAARDNDRFPSATYACHLAAPIPGAPEASPHRRFLDRMGLFGIEVAREALAAADARAGAMPAERLGLFCGVGGLRVRWGDLLPALSKQRARSDGAWERGLRRLHPFWMLKHLSNNAHALISVEVRALGEGTTFAGAIAGVEAIAAASRALAVGAVDRALVVAYDSLIEPELVVELAARGAASCAPLDALRAPYDTSASGVVPGEAAVAMVLGPRDDRAAIARLDAATTADGSGSEPDPARIGDVVRRLGKAEIVAGAARAIPAHDAAEREVIATITGSEAPLVASASALGSLGAAAAAAQIVALVEMLKRGSLAPIVGLAHPAPGPLRPVLAAEPTHARSAIAIATGAPGLAGAVRVEVT
jgi:3-oxoacyl-(acyl-carrier-protein) synthase